MANLLRGESVLCFLRLCLIVSVVLTPLTVAIHCLVVRPGYGLVSEKCPHGTVGCRIRISKDAVDFYEYSALYDRNQYVCVHKSEFDGAKASGCTRKKSGRVRCWCHGRRNCNTPEASKQLYEAFINDDPVIYASVIKELDESSPVNEFSASMGFAELIKTTTTNNTSHRVSVVKVPILPHRRADHDMGQSNVNNSNTLKLGESNLSKEFIQKTGNKKTSSSMISDNVADVSNFKDEQTFSKSTEVGPNIEVHKLRNHNHYNLASLEDKKKAESKDSFDVDITPLQNDKTLIKSKEDLATIGSKVFLDQNNEVHVIHAQMQDRYDQVTGIFNLVTAFTLNDDFPVTPPPSADDLYDENELNRMDAEYAQQQKEQNRPRPTKLSMRVLPQHTDTIFEKDNDPPTQGEYDDMSAKTPGNVVSLIILIGIPLFMH